MVAKRSKIQNKFRPAYGFGKRKRSEGRGNQTEGGIVLQEKDIEAFQCLKYLCYQICPFRLWGMFMIVKVYAKYGRN